MKRKLDGENGALVLKKQKTEEDQQIVVSESKDANKQLVYARTSNLQAPIMQLEGHGAEIYTLKFSPNGNTLASGSLDKTIMLWNVYGDCTNYGHLKGHTNAILDLVWTNDSNSIYTASADKSLIMWDCEYGHKVRRYKGHQMVVNSVSTCFTDSQIFVSGSDDGSAKIWDNREKKSINSLDCKFPVLSVAFSEDGNQIFTAGIDPSIRVWDKRKNDVLYRLEGHRDTITGISVSKDGNYLLSNSMDNTVRLFDIRPYAKERALKVFYGIQHGVDKNLLRCSWSPDGYKITAGSADAHVYIWDTNSRQILYKLPGHKATVNEVVFHPNEPIIASASSDKTIFMGEI